MTKRDDNRTRYELLFDRRRALRELERLAARLASRQGDDPARVEGIMDEVKRQLSSRAGQASCAQILRDVRTIYRGLVELSRMWVEEAPDPAARLDSRK